MAFREIVDHFIKPIAGAITGIANNGVHTVTLASDGTGGITAQLDSNYPVVFTGGPTIATSYGYYLMYEVTNTGDTTDAITYFGRTVDYIP